MNERLQIILKEKSLSATQLAGRLGVQPSSISHILSGRNKPGFDIITRILETFPEINPDWFLLGKLPIYRGPNKLESALEPQLRFDPVSNPDVAQNIIDQKSEKFDSNSSAIGIPNRTIKKILVLYDDGSFEAFDSGKSI